MKRLISLGLSILVSLSMFSNVEFPASAATVYLSEDEQWIVGLTTDYEYITEQTYEKYDCEEANNKYWSSLKPGTNTRPDGTPYQIVGSQGLTEGNKLQVASAWYGKNVYFRERGTSGKGTVVKIPEFSQLKEQYKRAIKIFNAYPKDSESFYGNTVSALTDNNGYLKEVDGNFNIRVTTMPLNTFNRNAKNVLTDAEGNYIYDLFTLDAMTHSESDISGNAAWILRDYLDEGYGFLIGHDTIYGYGGVTDSDYVPDINDKETKEYILNTNINGHWNVNWLLGVNKKFTETSPYEADSMILSNSDWRDKSALFGNTISYTYNDTQATVSILKVKKVIDADTENDVFSRTPTNYPYSELVKGVKTTEGLSFNAGITHSNMQQAYGTIWVEFDTSKPLFGKLIEDVNDGVSGTNNFYLTTNGNIGMSQIGHMDNTDSTAKDAEARLLLNTMLYLAQREPCLICQSEQGGHERVHSVTRISSVEELKLIGDPNYSYTYPADGCYVLTKSIQLPEDWEPIEGFSGHFNAAGHKIVVGENKVFKQSGLFNLGLGGWNLGTDNTKGLNKISSNRSDNLTGIARVYGKLPDLFKTNDVNYDGYYIVLTDKNGIEYDAVVNREGIYVISNIATMPREKLYAKVYTDKTKEKEVTEYGNIYAIIEENAWNNNMTVPLELENNIGVPIKDVSVYEETEAVFTVKYENDTLPTKVEWKYLEPFSSEWKNISELVTDYNYEVELIPAEKTTEDGKSYIITELVIKEPGIDLQNFNFKAVVTITEPDGATSTFDTFNEREEGFRGNLTIKEFPSKVEPVDNVKTWVGEKLELNAQQEYYKPIGDKAIQVEWQARYKYEGEETAYAPIDSCGFISGYTVSNKSTQIGVAPEDGKTPIYKNESTLIIENATIDLDNVQFNAVFYYDRYERFFPTYPEYTAGKEGLADVAQSTLYCVTNPKNIDLSSTNGTATGNYTFTSEFEYTGNSEDIDVSWEFKPSAIGTFKDISKSPYASKFTVSSPVITSLGDNKYKVKTTLTVKDPSDVFNNVTNHYYFRARAEVPDGKISYSSHADIIVRHTVDIIPKEPIVIGNSSNIAQYRYSNLDVYAPNKAYYFQVKITNSTNANTTVNLGTALSGVTALEGNKGFKYESTTNPLTEEQIEIFLRNLVFNIADTSAEVEWRISESSMSNGYNPFIGKAYEVVPISDGITWQNAYTAATQRFNSNYQVYGKLATIKNDEENGIVTNLLNAKGQADAWIGFTKDTNYNGNISNFAWINNGGLLSYSKLQSSLNSGPYGYINNSGNWGAAQSSSITKFTDKSVVVSANKTSTSTSQSKAYDLWTNMVTVTLKDTDGTDLTPYITSAKISTTGSVYYSYGSHQKTDNIIRYLEYYNKSNVKTTVSKWPGDFSDPYVRDWTFNISNLSGGLSKVRFNWRQNAGAMGASSSTAEITKILVSGSRSVKSTKNAYVVEYVVNENPSTHTATTAKATDTLAGGTSSPPVIGGDPQPATATYRTKTDVIISCGVTALNNINAENPASVTFNIKGVDGTVTPVTFNDVCLPAGANQRAWVRYTIGSLPGTMTVEVITSGEIIADTSIITATVEKITEIPPDDPLGTDRKPAGFSLRVPTLDTSKTQHTWTTYTAQKVGEQWEYEGTEHTATLRVSVNSNPDSLVPTAIGKNMKSGYGLNTTVTGQIVSDITDYELPQTVITYFPEFQYNSERDFRIMQETNVNSYRRLFEYKPNEYSIEDKRVHFTPVWFPDGNYKLQVKVRDAWTPVGELQGSFTEAQPIQIKDSIFDDWYAKEKP